MNAINRVIREPYERTDRVLKTFAEETRTKQSHKDETDINRIMAKYLKTGVIMHGTPKQGSYIELPEQFDFHTAQNYIKEAEQAFMQMPASLRKKFDNDPGRFVDFVENPDNYDELIELGLARARPERDQSSLDVTGPTDTTVSEHKQPEGE